MGGLSQSRKADALRSAPLFEGLSKKDLVELARVTDDLQVPAGTVLCKEGALGREFFVLVEGSVDITKGGKKLATKGGGDYVGEIALLTSMRRTATVTAATPLRLLILMGADFRRVLDEKPAIQRKVMSTLAERLVAVTADPAA